jgi:hypothetical protein
MRRIPSIGLAAVVLTVTALPALADDQSISFATGAIGSATSPANIQHAQTTRWLKGTTQRAVPSPYGAYAQGGGNAQWNCTFVGPKDNLMCR